MLPQYGVTLKQASRSDPLVGEGVVMLLVRLTIVVAIVATVVEMLPAAAAVGAIVA